MKKKIIPITLLTGYLGAGKTTFTKFVLKALSVKDIVTSPTFTIMREYKTKKFNIYHQFLCSKNQILVLNAYARMREKRSKNELEKPFNKL